MKNVSNKDSYNKIAVPWTESRNNSFVSKLIIGVAIPADLKRLADKKGLLKRKMAQRRF